MTMFRNLHLGLTALLVAALAGCDSVLIPGPGDEAEESPYACWFDADTDSFVTPFGVDAQGFEIDLRQYDAVSLEDCRTRFNGGEPLAWGRTDRVDPDDTDECVGPSPSGWGVADLCPDGAGDDDSDDGDDDQGDDDDDTADDDHQGDDDAGDDDDSDDLPGDPDNGDAWVNVIWDADDATGSNNSALQDPILGELYVENHPNSGWFDGDTVPVTELSGNRFRLSLQCNRTWKVNGTVNGSNVFSPNQGYIVHDLPNSDNSDSPHQWGAFGSEIGTVDVSSWLQDNGDGGDGMVHVDCSDM